MLCYGCLSVRREWERERKRGRAERQEKKETYHKTVFICLHLPSFSFSGLQRWPSVRRTSKDSPKRIFVFAVSFYFHIVICLDDEILQPKVYDKEHQCTCCVSSSEAVEALLHAVKQLSSYTSKFKIQTGERKFRSP